MYIYADRRRARRGLAGEVAVGVLALMGACAGGFLVGSYDASVEARGELVSERIQRQRAEQALVEYRHDTRVIKLCDHIRRHLTSVPEVCR